MSQFTHNNASSHESRGRKDKKLKNCLEIYSYLSAIQHDTNTADISVFEMIHRMHGRLMRFSGGVWFNLPSLGPEFLGIVLSLDLLEPGKVSSVNIFGTFIIWSECKVERGREFGTSFLCVGVLNKSRDFGYPILSWLVEVWVSVSTNH